MAGQHNIYKKRILLPLWTIQLIALVVFLGLAALVVGVWNHYEDEIADYDSDLADAGDAINIVGAVQLAISIFTILMVFVEMVLFYTHRLAPVAFLVMQCITSLIWTIFFIIVVVGVASGGGAAASIFITLVIFVTSIGLLAYAATLVHRKRKGTLYRGGYAVTPTAAAHYETGYTGGTSGNPFRDPSRDPSPAPPYDPASQGQAAEYYGSGDYEMSHGAGR